MMLKYKILALTVLPLVLSICAVAVLVQYRAKQLAEHQAALIEENFMVAKRTELKHHLGLALSSIAPLYALGGDKAKNQAQAKDILASINYGEDGYFFAYDVHGRNIVHPRQPELVGQPLWDLKDPAGRLVIRDLLESASHGDGYLRYEWAKPSSGQVTEKLGYVVMIPQWGWMIGTGIYLDDVEHATAMVRERARDNVHATMLGLGGVTLVAVLLVFMGGVALNVSEHRLADSKLKAMAHRIVNLQEEERARVSRELHDGISQVLVSTQFHFELAQHKLENGREGAVADLRKGLAGLAGAITEVRRISHDLRPSILDTLGLEVAIIQLANEFALRTGIQVDIGRPEQTMVVPNDQVVALFRIAQEALTNIERHARASEVKVQLMHDGDHVQLEIIDNGRGFDSRSIERAGGIGLRNIRERVEHLAGQFILHSTVGHTCLRVRLPVTPKATP
ncbi:cache domain-containing protein [Chitinimonas sp. PSY-7]|uniref:cache domain-containing protein n=1 Tax=Chitinimonas sp. PSY-7 TaxID=3459088 RepID=UPI00403FFFBE